MSIIGRIKEILPVPGRRARVTIEVTAPAAEVENLKDKDVELKKYKRSRSNDSNGYYWVLVGKLCAYDRMGRTEMHNRLIAEFGQDSFKDGALEWVAKPEGFDWTRSEDGHYRPSKMKIKASNVDDHNVINDGELLDIYWVMRGSSTYNTEEMAALIDGAIEMCKERGIETMTPDELARMFREGNDAGVANNKV